MEGDVLTLHAGFAQMEGYSEVIWYFTSAGRTTRIAQMNRGRVVKVYKESLAHRLKLDQTSGSLTICNISISDSGVYEVSQTIKLHVYEKKFRVDVHAPVSVPAIERNSKVTEHNSSGTLKPELCLVLCSVKNGRDVLISWHKGGEMVKQSSSPELNISLSLSLELHYEDAESYSCTAHNPVSNKSIQLQLRDFCRTTQEDCQDHCGAIEALIRLVLSGLVGIATVLFLFDHLRLCSAQDGDAAVSVC
nr:T-lymphocyte surface antigen Ly-9-like [Danio rerio]|eukprot:XP_021325726.1 T-lymphocyte surface antigen Ly-9-like [Danio rerio]